MGKYIFLISTNPNKDKEGAFRIFNAISNAVEFKQAGDTIALRFASFGLQAFITNNEKIKWHIRM